jgi:hypothetical protein
MLFWRNGVPQIGVQVLARQSNGFPPDEPVAHQIRAHCGYERRSTRGESMSNSHRTHISRHPEATAFLAVAFLVSALAAAFAQVSFQENVVESQYGTNLFAAPCDLDEDGWMDILVTDRLNDQIVWLRNNGETLFDQHPIPDTDGYLTYPYLVDLDEDGDTDLLGATNDDGEVCWWENDGDENFTRHILGVIGGGHRTIAVDLDEDLDLDVVACGLDHGGNKWFENDGDEHFVEHVISPSRTSHCVDWGDFDDDGDIDLVTTDLNVGLVLWENDGDENFSSTPKSFPYAHWVLVDDIDDDGDPDLVAVAYNPSAVAWWENDGAGSFTRHTISTSFLGPLVVDTADLDEDDDTDIAVAAVNSHEISWWENDGNEGFTEHPLTAGTYTNATSVQIADLDGDSDADLVCTGHVQPCVRWYESDIVDMSFTVDPHTGVAPLTVALTDSSTSRYAITDRAWDCDLDGSIDVHGQTAPWTYQTPGSYSVLLEVSMGERVGRVMLRDQAEAFDTGSALWFGGVSGVVSCADSPMSELTGSLTVEAWISPFGWGGFPIGAFGFGQLLDKGSVSLLLTGAHPARNNESVYLELKHRDGTVSGASAPVGAIALDEWQHVAATYDGVSTVRMWIDGTEQTVTYSVAPSGSLDVNGAVTLGNIAGTLNRTFEGSLDEVRLWSVARSEAEIQGSKDAVLSGSEPGLVGYWKLDEGNGQTTVDGSPGGGDGAITDATWVQGVILYATSVPESGDDDIWAAFAPQLATAPNPFGRATSIALTLPCPSDVRVTVHDLAGRVVREITDLHLDAGIHTFEWDGRNREGLPVATGVYFCRATSEHGNASGKMLLLH